MLRLALLLIVMLFGSLASTTAVAGTIETTCSRIGSSYGPNAFECDLHFQGEIAQGDAIRVAEAIQASPSFVSMAEFDSPGGNPFEALRIADILNSKFVMFSAPYHFIKDGRDEIRGGTICASACALIYLAANHRTGTEVYVHRPTFPADLFAKLNGKSAEIAYDSALNQLKAGLRARHVPDDQIQVMMMIPSEEVRQLPSDYPSESPWLAEWLTARCGPQLAVGPDEIAANGGYRGIVKNMLCRGDAFIEEARRVQGKQ